VIDLMENGLSLISLHTRMDAAPGGLNEAFGTLLGIRPDSSVVLLPEEPFIGGIGDLDRSISPAALAERVSSSLSAPVKLYSAGRDVKRIGYCCGAGKDLVLPSLERGADAFVSGDLSYHVVQEAVEKGMTVIDCGHHASEKNAAFLLRDEILKFAPEMEIHPILEPLNGEFVDFSQLFCSNSTT